MPSYGISKKYIAKDIQYSTANYNVTGFSICDHLGHSVQNAKA